MENRLKFPLAVILFSLLLALGCFVGLGKAYRSNLTPTSHYGTFKRIGSDGWIEKGSVMSLRDLASRGNRLELQFNPWRPDSSPAHLAVSVCGREVSRLSVSAQATKHLVFSYPSILIRS